MHVWLCKIVSKTDPYNRGDRYESTIEIILRDHGTLKPDFERAGAAGNQPDLIFVHNEQEYNLEAKRDQKADFGQKYLKWQEKNKKFVWSVDDTATRLYTKVGVLDFINSVENSRRFHLNKISKSNDEITKIDNKEDQNFFDMNFKIPQDEDLLAQFYNDKNVYYIQIGKHSVIRESAKRAKKVQCGFYHLGSDPAGLGTQKFDGYMLIRFRAKQIRSEPVYNYGLTAVLKYYPTIKSASNSKFNIEDDDEREFPPITP